MKTIINYSSKDIVLIPGLDVPRSRPHGEEVWRSYTPKIFRLMTQTTISTIESVGNENVEALTLYFFLSFSLSLSFFGDGRQLSKSH